MILLQERMVGLEKGIVDRSRRRYLTSIAKLDAMSPLKVLTRGYAMAQRTDGKVIKSIHDVNNGDRLLVRVSDGHIAAMVESSEEE